MRIQLTSAGIGLGTHDSSTPVAADILVLVVVSLLGGGDELGKLSLVLGADLGESKDSSGLLVDHSSETGLTLDNAVGDTHLAAKGGKEDNQLNGVNIVGDEDQGSLLVLDQTNNVVKTVLDSVGLLGDILLLLSVLDGLGLTDETLLLLSLGLGAVLVEETEELGGKVLVGGVLELGERRGDLQAHVEDLLLALKTDILGPLDETRQVALGLDILTNTEVAGTLLDERVLWLLSTLHEFAGRGLTYLGLLSTSLSLGERGGGSLLLGNGGLWSLRDFESANILQRNKISSRVSRLIAV